MRKKAKIEQLQIRVSKSEKETILAAARRANMGMSEWVLSKILPSGQANFLQLVDKLATAVAKQYVIAEIHDLLNGATKEELGRIVSVQSNTKLPAYWSNYLAAMVEYAAHNKGLEPPSWTEQIKPLPEPAFGSDLKNLRLHLLTHSPVPFRRRNIFIDSSIGARV